MRYSLELVTAPAVEPITLGEAKAHLRVDIDDDDALIGALIKAAREKAEQLTGRAFVSQVWRLRLDGFPSEADAAILLPQPPLRAVQSLQYVDGGGALQDLYATDAVSPAIDGHFDINYWSEPGYLVPAYGKYWPSTRTQPGAVVVTFEAGYPYLETSPLDQAENVPAAVKAAIKLMVGHWYEHREAAGSDEFHELPFAVGALLDTVKVTDFRLSHA